MYEIGDDTLIHCPRLFEITCGDLGRDRKLLREIIEGKLIARPAPLEIVPEEQEKLNRLSLKLQLAVQLFNGESEDVPQPFAFEVLLRRLGRISLFGSEFFVSQGEIDWE